MQPLPGAEAFSSALAARLAALPTDAKAPSPPYSNRLALESSPYLLQHAHNPVNWYAWGDEAFADARRLGRPVFLSIGYATCHWCHVMEKESFEDQAIATTMNTHYICIKVDREERPDVDAVYMSATQQLTGSGGWPMSVWLTPEREPFFAGTYFPPYAGSRGAGPGFMDILTELVRLYELEPMRIRKAAQTLTAVVRDVMAPGTSADKRPGPAARPGTTPIAAAVDQCHRAFDEQNGGLLLQQKFPSNVPLRLLLRHHQRTGDARALSMAVRTLAAMAQGGIYDHVAGGFHRYATDSHWLVPHFEKMLYDNALLITAYTEAWQVTKRPDFARVVRETCDELLETFLAPEGGFFSAMDADSEGHEGKFYVWSEEELRSVLGPGEDTDLFLGHYGVTARGNFELGNILHQRQPDEDLTQRLTPLRAKLAQVRRQRVPPLRDDKILASWNGLAISAFAIASRVFGEPRYLDSARRAADFVVTRMRRGDGQLARSYRDGRLGTSGFLDDYAFLAAGLLDLFESTHELRWFDEAHRLADETETLFADKERGGWFMASEAHEKLLARERPLFDGAEPSGSSIALMNAARLAAFTDQPRWREVAQRALASYGPQLEERPMAMTETLVALDFLIGPVHEIALALPDAKAADDLAQVLRRTFCPRKVLVVGVPDSAEWRALETKIPFARDKVVQGGRPTAYICQLGRCQLPTTDALLFQQQIVAQPTV
jgi:uncharacterized protein YyaL (SSP411 family)